ncbi:MAG: hypothetical protein ACYTG2_19225 [Planctomycetota bacterium]|jgi:hypothetical protein
MQTIRDDRGRFRRATWRDRVELACSCAMIAAVILWALFGGGER